MKRTLLIDFQIVGDLCALSHRETLTLWQRILMRCSLPLAYSSGFNPRPRISLPLPRAVGLQSDCDRLCAELTDRLPVPMEVLQPYMGSLLPNGCEVKEIRIVDGKPHYTACQTEYLFERCENTDPQYWQERLDRGLRQHSAKTPVLLRRESPKHKTKTINVLHFIKTLTGNQNTLRIRCRIDASGSVRLEELMQWLQIEPADLAQPPRRPAVVWIQNEIDSV